MTDAEVAAAVDEGWTAQLAKVERITPMDPGEVEDGNLFSVEFEVTAPNLNGSVEVLVSDIADEAQVITEALDALERGLATWARVVARRKGASLAEPEES